MALKIPIEFKKKLDENNALLGLVNLSISEFEPWLERNNVKFFTEYTDHGPKHIEGILQTSDELIRVECRGIITPADIATLVLATLLHDCAMHISVDGFIELIQANDRPIIQGFNDKPWNFLWLDFLAEARRFSGRKLMALFGNTESVTYPPMNSNDMSERDLLLIGEFLRRHHHRLAHEIALLGVPGPTENKLKLPSSDDTKYIVELAGIVARSHGMNIRDCVDYLKDNYSSEKVYKGVHTIFIMALLRISDILQIQSNRAPKQIEKIQKIQSPISLAEHEMHQAIRDINKYQYSETILIDARPTNARTYVRIRNLLNQIQNELDLSWTIIGEIYGYDPQLRELGMKIRRVRSNIDNIDEFSKHISYIPTQASFEVADTDLLKLLIAPLYGDDPKIGIRELLQNSVDAVRELKQYQKNHPELANVNFTDLAGDIEITVSQDKENIWWLILSDRGIGMRMETVKNYFLKAGASLRRNELWRKTFEDENGKSKVLRSGRFGIGALATFLLGNEFYLSTRYIEEDAENGIELWAQLESEFIEMKRINRPIGTTIRIQISEDTKERLGESFGKESQYFPAWDWYCLEEPIVTRKMGQDFLEQKYHLPSPLVPLPITWRRVEHKDYLDIQWTWEEIPPLVCNGIKVSDNPISSFKDAVNIFSVPNISVFDPDAKLPLNLQRTELTQRQIPFEKELLESVIKDFISYILVNAPEQSFTDSSATNWYASPSYRGFRPYGIRRYPSVSTNAGISQWFFHNSGVGLNIDSWQIDQIKTRSALVTVGSIQGIINYKNENVYAKMPIIPKTSQIQLGYFMGGRQLTKSIGVQLSSTIQDLIIYGPNRISLLNKMLNLKTKDTNQIIDSPENLFRQGKRILIDRKTFENHEKVMQNIDLAESIPLKYQEYVSKIEKEWEDSNWILLSIDNCPESEFNFINFAETHSPNERLPKILAELYFKKNKVNPELTSFTKIWQEFIGLPTIPLDLKERQKQLAKAYIELKPYIEIHKSIRARMAK